MPDRATFFKEVSSALDFLMLHPESSTQKWVMLAVTAFVLIVSLSRFHKWGKAVRSGFLLSIVAVSVSVFFMMVSAVWGWHLIKELGLVQGQEEAGLAILLGIAFFAGVGPWTRFCFKAAYFTSIAAWILALSLTTGAVYGSQWAWKKADAPVEEDAAKLRSN